ncbi:MAG: cupredoxin domain-containing protein [Porticoccaceae bacterium]
MKKSLSILILSALPVLALASGDHAGSHDMRGDTAQMPHDMEGMSRGGHDGAAGKSGDPAKVGRTIEVTMDDTMRFTPDALKVKGGETIRFAVKNAGKMPHEMVIGSTAELKEHAEMMRKMPGMQHAEPNMVTLDPGQRGDIIWQFDKAGAVDFACLVPGHYEAGMKGTVQVE